MSAKGVMCQNNRCKQTSSEIATDKGDPPAEM